MDQSKQRQSLTKDKKQKMKILKTDTIQSLIKEDREMDQRKER